MVEVKIEAQPKEYYKDFTLQFDFDNEFWNSLSDEEKEEYINDELFYRDKEYINHWVISKIKSESII